VTTQNLRVAKVDPERGLIMICGSVPGSKGGWILLRDAIKKELPKDAPTPGAFRMPGESIGGDPAQPEPSEG